VRDGRVVVEAKPVHPQPRGRPIGDRGTPVVGKARVSGSVVLAPLLGREPQPLLTPVVLLSLLYRVSPAGELAIQLLNTIEGPFGSQCHPDPLSRTVGVRADRPRPA